MASIIKGPRDVSATIDSDGHRTYKLKWRILSDRNDGPYRIFNTPGLPQPGSPWIFEGEIDVDAWCRPDMVATPIMTPEPNNTWDLEQTWSTRPLAQCQDSIIEDPLREPMKVSGGFRRSTTEPTKDRFGRTLKNSAHERLRGPGIEFDKSYPTVRIEQNVANLQYDLLVAMIDTVNDRTLWGNPRRTVKLSRVSWECKYSGYCRAYYTRVLEFDIDHNTFDRDVLDEGTKVLSGRWSTSGPLEWLVKDINGVPADPNNPKHFIVYTDTNGNPQRSVLNGRGLPADVFVSEGNRFVSITEGNIANDVEDSSNWLPMTDDLSVPYDEESAYPMGTVVNENAGTYVALIDFPTLPPGSDQWVELPAWVNMGVYNSATSYSIGNFVTADISTISSAGKIHVEYFGETNLLLLGLPTVLRCQ